MCSVCVCMQDTHSCNNIYNCTCITVFTDIHKSTFTIFAVWIFRFLSGSSRNWLELSFPATISFSSIYIILNTFFIVAYIISYVRIPLPPTLHLPWRWKLSSLTSSSLSFTCSCLLSSPIYNRLCFCLTVNLQSKQCSTPLAGAYPSLALINQSFFSSSTSPHTS